MSSVDFKTAVKQEEKYLHQVHPTTDDIPTCMKLFDEALLCHVLNAQMKSLYRFGHMSNCGPKIEDFKFCMTIKSLHPEEKRDVWLRHRAEWWAHRRLTRSSEDVWDMRTEPLLNYPPNITDNAHDFNTIE